MRAISRECMASRLTKLGPPAPPHLTASSSGLRLAGCGFPVLQPEARGESEGKSESTPSASFRPPPGDGSRLPARWDRWARGSCSRSCICSSSSSASAAAARSHRLHGSSALLRFPHWDPAARGIHATASCATVVRWRRPTAD